MKQQEFTDSFFKHYLDHFSPQFLFISGDLGYPKHFITRHSMRGMGELYVFQIVILFLGFFASAFQKKSGWILVLLLLFLYPLGSALTGEGPFATRSIIGILPLTLYSGLGMEMFFSFWKNRWLKYFSYVLAVAIILISFHSYLSHYYKEYPKYSADYWGWQYGPRDILADFLEWQDQYDALIMTPDFNAAQIFIPFYTKGTCPKCTLGWMQHHFDPSKRQRFAVKPNELEKFSQKDRFDIKRTLYYPNGDIAFIIGDVLP